MIAGACSIYGMKWRAILLLLPVLVLLLAGGAYFLREDLANYWIRARLARELSEALGADVDLQGVAWKSGLLQARRVRIAGGDLPFVRLEAREVRAVVDWRRLLEPSAEPLHVEAAEAEIVWRNPDEGRTPRDTATAGGLKAAPPLDLLVNRLEFRHPDVADWSIEGSAVRAVNRDGEWSFSGSGGTLQLPTRSPLHIERFSAEHRGGVWHIGSFALKDTKGGVVAGSAAHENGQWSGEFSWQDIDIAPFLPESVNERVSGASNGDAIFKDGGLTGKMKITGGQTKQIGLVVKLADLIDHEDWSTVPWHIFQFDFTRHADGRIEFSDLQMLSEKGLAVRGSGHYATESIGADLQVGVRRKGRPYLGAFVPILFSHESDGYCWTSVKVGGKPDAPTENLSARVASALAVVPATSVIDSAVEIPAAAGEATGNLLRNLLRR